MNTTPLVSIIIPVYNRQHLIQRSIYSVLNQSYKNLEVIVINDASNDATEEKIQQITDVRLKYFRNSTNVGPSGSRNSGIKISSGEFIAFQDSDDEWYPDKLEKQIDCILSSSPDTGAVYCGMEYMDFVTGKKSGETVRETDFRKNFTMGNHILTPANVTVLIKRDVLNEVGYFDERLKASEDTELAIRISKKYKYAFIPEPLVKVTRNHDQLMGNTLNYIRAKEIIIEKHDKYLSKKILFGTCKIIANYYILTRNYQKAKEYLLRSLTYILSLKTFLQLFLLRFPVIIEYFYNNKYKGNIPLTSGLRPSNEGTVKLNG